MGRCYSCGTELADDKAVYRSSVCPSCGKDVRVCLNCRFYEPGAHWDCRETISELVRDKDRANFCEHFELARERPTAPGTQKESNPRSAFDKLFDDE